jgi:hypothetical protein
LPDERCEIGGQLLVQLHAPGYLLMGFNQA